MSDFKFNCPHCDQSLEAPQELLGQETECPACGGVIHLPEPEASSACQTPRTALVDTRSAPASPPPIPQKKTTKEEVSASGDRNDYTRYGFPNYAKYAEFTKTQDWKSICALNNVDLDSFGTKKELKVLPNYLEDGEVVFALTSGIMKQTHTSNASDSGVNTWLVVLTNERFLFLDHALLTKSVDTQSIRHDRVQAVSSSQGWLLGKITVDIGARTVVVDNCQKATVQPMAGLANKWLAVLQKKKDEAPASSSSNDHSPLDEIKKLAELHSMGALSDEEFTAAKTKLLAAM